MTIRRNPPLSKPSQPKEVASTIKPSSSSSPLLQPPRTLIDITFQQLIGKGSFGEVWRGIWKPGTTVALKADLPSCSTSFPTESILLNYCNHPNVVRMFGTFTNNDQRNWIVMEHCKCDLQSQLETSSMSTPQIIELAKDVAKGMFHLNALNIVHRDLSARNLLVAVEAGRFVAKIADLGLACYLGDKRSILCKSKFNPLITAPEAKSSGIFSEQSDVWSFGILLYHMFTKYSKGSREEIIMRINSDHCSLDSCPQAIRKLMKDCIHQSPYKRPTFAQVFEHLHNASMQLCDDKQPLVEDLNIQKLSLSEPEVYYDGPS